MTTKIREFGRISKDGKLLLPMDRVNQFLQAHPGKNIIVRFEVAEPGSSAAQLAYYRQYIVPTVQAALVEIGERMTEGQVDLWLRKQCASCYDENGDLLKAEQMSQSDFSDFIDWIKRIAAENLYIYIEDPKTI